MKNYNWQIVGHEKNIEFLQKNIDNNKLTHAYLFSGKEHLGKRLIVDKFVNSILCNDYQQKNKQEIKNSPCGKCVFCTQLAKGIHADVFYLKKEEDKKNITVEQVREMQKISYMGSFLNSYKIAVIDKADNLSESAQNALLKILEEPKQKTILILLTSDYNLLLPTIVSRCQLIKFLPVSNEQIFHHLISLGATREQARVFTALSNGQIGLAINFIKQPELYNIYLAKISKFLDILNNNLFSKFKILDELLSGMKNNLEISNYLYTELDYWQSVFRDLLVVQNNLDHLLINIHFKPQLVKVAPKYSSLKIIELLGKIKAIKQILTYNINPRLAVENFILNF